MSAFMALLAIHDAAEPPSIDPVNNTIAKAEANATRFLRDFMDVMVGEAPPAVWALMIENPTVRSDTHRKATIVFATHYSDTVAPIAAEVFIWCIESTAWPATLPSQCWVTWPVINGTPTMSLVYNVEGFSS